MNVSGVGQYGQGGRQVDGDDHPGSGEDLVLVGGAGGQPGDGDRPVPVHSRGRQTQGGDVDTHSLSHSYYQSGAWSTLIGPDRPDTLL